MPVIAVRTATSKLHRSLQVSAKFCFINLVLVDGAGNIVAGHGRVVAAKQIGLTNVPTINVGWMTKERRRAYIMADNQLALNAGWDESILVQEVAWLMEH